MQFFGRRVGDIRRLLTVSERRVHDRYARLSDRAHRPVGSQAQSSLTNRQVYRYVTRDTSRNFRLIYGSRVAVPRSGMAAS